MKTFQELALIEPLQRALAAENHITPTPVQARTIPASLEGQDVLGCAQTGTGKTAAFALPILNQLGESNRKARPNRPFVLVLAPTRELAVQIGKSFSTYGKFLRLRTTLVYGGVGQRPQVRALERGTHILVATPGRLLDLIGQGHIELNQLETLVLDEADRMLDMGFLPDIRKIMRMLPDDRQSLFFSATLGPRITSLSQQLLTDPVSVDVTPTSRSVDLIEQRVAFVEQACKTAELIETLSGPDVGRVLVFTRTKRAANDVAKDLGKSGFAATAIHGNKSQNARQRALDDFRSNKVRVLVATDVAARGIDIAGVTHVINFDLPVEPECYVHRIGRTGRAGAEGIAVSFCSRKEHGDLRAIEALIGEEISAAEGHARPEGGLGRSKFSSKQRSGGQKRYNKSGSRGGYRGSSNGGKSGGPGPRGRRNARRGASHS